MTTGVVTYIYDQCITVNFRQITAMELGITARPHVGNVDITGTAGGGFMYKAPICFDPTAVAHRVFFMDGAYNHRTCSRWRCAGNRGCIVAGRRGVSGGCCCGDWGNRCFKDRGGWFCRHTFALLILVAGLLIDVVNRLISGGCRWPIGFICCCRLGRGNRARGKGQ